MTKPLRFFIHFVLVSSMMLAGSAFVSAQNIIKGKIIDKSTGETIIGATVLIKGTQTGSTTDIDGKFEIKTDKPFPVTLTITFVGYAPMEYVVENAHQKVVIKLATNDVMLQAVEVVDSRISDKQKQEPLTVESMDVISIKEAPSGNFYESLGTLKGVDMTSASLGFKVINTRGFNSTSPVRSLQVIDGVDNQSPGLNFSLGNFLGASDLDVKRVNIVAGASSAYYGPGAFNGVIAIETKDPFTFPGLSVSLKGGERSLFEAAVRWAQVIKNKEGEAKFGYKINFFYFQARDWEAENYDPTEDSDDGINNPGGYDAVNIYGDENVYLNNDYTGPIGQFEQPGLFRYYRTGYREVDLADYDTRNFKANLSLYYNINKKIQLIYAFNYGYGTTIYQGDNRFSLRDIQFMQNRLEIKQDGRFFFRVYATHEDGGNTFDIYSAALKIQDEAVDGEQWNINYKRNWNFYYKNAVRNLPGYPQATFPLADWVPEHEAFLFASPNIDSLFAWHARNRELTDGQSGQGQVARYEPGTARFDSLYNKIVTTKNNLGGSMIVDKSALYHAQGEYRITPKWGEIVMGGNARLYRPYSEGTIFDDSLTHTWANTDSGRIAIDSAYRRISNFEYGIYAGITGRLFDETLILNATLRMDKNQNFDYLFSPALSVVYTLHRNHTFRVSFSSAIRNPTLADQYLYLDVGRAILKGNLDGFDSLVTVESFNDYRYKLNVDTLEYFSVAPVEPEKVKTLEIGYRGTLGSKVYVDANVYYSWYDKFIGYSIGLDFEYDPFTKFPTYLQAYRLATNAQTKVTTAGASVGINYYFIKNFTLYGNYSWNKLTKQDENDPLIPAFNTPEHKFNIGITGRDIRIPWTSARGLGFGVNYKWLQGFVFEGSPQFTGPISSYGIVDAQINYVVKKIHTTFKIGASNLFNNKVYQVYGGPQVGRLAYISILFDWNMFN